MKIGINNKISKGLKLTGLVIFVALLSGCPALPHHGNSNGHGQSSYSDYDTTNHHSRSRSYSNDY